MVQNAACEKRSLRCREKDLQSGPLHFFKAFANPRIRHASEKPSFTVMLTIGSDRLTYSVVSVGLQQDLHDLFEWGPDDTSYIAGFIRFMSKGAQCRKAACQNAGIRIDQGAVEV